MAVGTAGVIHHNPDVPGKRTTRPPRRAPPLYKAAVIETADSSSIRVNSSTADIDEAILARIKKCLERANHPNAAKAEARAALYLAFRLMKQFNVTQAEVMAHETPETQRKYAGQSTVAILRRDGNQNKTVQENIYIDPLVCAVEAYFTTKAYITHEERSLEITFYGISENTATAANAFEMVFNLIVERARKYPGQNGKNSYCVGIADGLLRHAEKLNKDEEARAKKAEQDTFAARVKEEEVQRQAALHRLGQFPTEGDMADNTAEDVSQDECEEVEDDRSSTMSPDSWNPLWASSTYDDDDDDEVRQEFIDNEDKSGTEELGEFIEDDVNDTPVDLTEYTNALVDAIAKELRSASSHSPPDSITQPTSEAPISQATRTYSTDSIDPTYQDPILGHAWASHMQLITFRETATKIADEYLRGQGIQKYQSKKGDFSVVNPDVYKQGKKDSKKIDVLRKTIKETVAGEQPELASSRLYPK
ncbi:Hypothetical predicted protein [Lecanosticta acicola]|uniref:DUF2786 domain-containing protein n=1 Tax=Lecanosticta acicola TaxID=111012 RepID=A0AAI8YT86_9PEZI|nr:Hypothetical predicted protein [Lecanosticta acicola]